MQGSRPPRSQVSTLPPDFTRRVKSRLQYFTRGLKPLHTACEVLSTTAPISDLFSTTATMRLTAAVPGGS